MMKGIIPKIIEGLKFNHGETIDCFVKKAWKESDAGTIQVLVRVVKVPKRLVLIPFISQKAKIP